MKQVLQPTRTFLFADLRDYTGFVERHGDRAAADLLAAYRAIVRSQVRKAGGAEIKTEGDGFYVVFPSALQAISCGAAVLKEAADHSSRHPELPMQVGIGLHAGEPIPQEGQFVGSAVNVAARIGAAAQEGQLLVSDVVRGLVRTGSPFPLRDQGEVLLKGVGEAIRLFSVEWSPDAPVPSDWPTMDSRPTRGQLRDQQAQTVFVGRANEMRQITATMDRVSQGAGAAVFLAGEPGIGKTRLARQAIDEAARRGFRVLEGRAYPLEGSLAYALIVDAFGAVLRSLDPARRSALTSGLPRLSLLFSGLQLAAPQPIGDAALEKTRLFEDVSQLLGRLVSQTPAVLFLDDLHWADPASIELLQYVTRGLEDQRLLILGTYRETEVDAARGLRSLLRSLDRAGHLEEIALSRLGSEAVTEMASSLLNGEELPELVELLHARSGGTPLFIEALVRSLLQGGQLVHTDRWTLAADASAVIPRSIRELILDRLERLQPNDRQVLGLIAACGDAAPYSLLTAASRQSEEACLDAIERLQKAGLIKEEPAGPQIMYVVTHPMIQEVTYHELAEQQRRRMHAAIASGMERLQPVDVERLAMHYRGAGPEVDPDRSLEVLLEAGERARGRYAHDEAARNLGAALTLVRQGRRPELLPFLLEKMGEAWSNVGEYAAATTIWEEALQNYHGAGELGSAARLHRRLAMIKWDQGQIEPAMEHIRAGTQLLAGQEPGQELADLIQARLIFQMRLDDLTGVSEAANELLELSNHLTLPRVRAHGQLAAASLAVLQTNVRTALAQAQSAVEAAEQAGDLLLQQRALDLLTLLAMSVGDLDAARSHAAESRRVSRQMGVPSLEALPRFRIVLLDLIGGRWDDAQRMSLETLVLIRRSGPPRGLVGILAIRAVVLTYHGELDEAAALIQEARKFETAGVDRNVFDFVDYAEALLSFERGDAERAVHLSRRMTPINQHVPQFLCLVAEAHASVGDASRANQLAQQLRAAAGAKSYPAALALRAEGLAERARGQPANAMARLASACELFAALEAPFDLARTQLDWAALALQQGETSAATARARESLEAFARLGARLYADRARRLLRELGVRPAPRPRTESGNVLRGRELEVARLAAAGLSNQEIAARLVISPRTVTSHLDHMYRRLGISARAELSRFLEPTQKIT